MILFYYRDDKKDQDGNVTGKKGDIFAVVDGRVHDEMHLKVYVNPGIPEELIGKYIIGWIEKNGVRTQFNLDKFPLLQEFESLSPVSPLEYRVDIESGELLKKDTLVEKGKLVEQKQPSNEEHPQKDAPINQ